MKLRRLLPIMARARVPEEVVLGEEVRGPRPLISIASSRGISMVASQGARIYSAEDVGYDLDVLVLQGMLGDPPLVLEIRDEQRGQAYADGTKTIVYGLGYVPRRQQQGILEKIGEVGCVE